MNIEPLTDSPTEILTTIIDCIENGDIDKMVEIHDRLLVTDIETVVEVLTVMTGKPVIKIIPFGEKEPRFLENGGTNPNYNGDESHTTEHHPMYQKMVEMFKQSEHYSKLFKRIFYGVPIWNGIVDSKKRKRGKNGKITYVPIVYTNPITGEVENNTHIGAEFQTLHSDPSVALREFKKSIVLQYTDFYKTKFGDSK